MEDIVLVGWGGHAKSVVDSIEKGKQYHIVGYTEINPEKKYKAYKYIGNDDSLQECFEKGIKNAFITLGYMGEGKQREKLYQRLKEIGFALPAIVDVSAILANDVVLGEGTFVGKNCSVNADAKIGKMCIINTGAVIEHECQIGDYAHVSVNCTLCGNVIVEDHCFVGANTTVIQNVRLGAGSVIGAASLVLRDVFPGKKTYGQIK